MQTIVDSLKAFQDKNIMWAPEQFLDIQDTRIRDCVRSAFRKPSEYLSNLTTRGTVEDMNAFEAALDDNAFLMKTAALAGFLDILYTLDQKQTLVSRELIQWYRQKGWNFPPFGFEPPQIQNEPSEDPKKIESE
jgi:hypothetical protein